MEAHLLRVGSSGFWVIYNWLPWTHMFQSVPGCSVSLSHELEMQSEKADCILAMNYIILYVRVSYAST